MLRVYVSIYFMKSLIEVKISKSSFQDTVSEYTSEGFEFLTSKPSEDNDYLIAIFRSEIHNASFYQTEKSYLEFEDGTTSPLYIKRERNFWED